MTINIPYVHQGGEHDRSPVSRSLDHAGIEVVFPQGSADMKPRQSRDSEVIAVISPKGGVGKSTLSLCLADLAARSENEPVALVDCDPDFGSLAAFASENPQPHQNLTRAVTDLDQPVDTFAVPLQSGCDLFSAPADGNTLHLLAENPESFSILIDRLKPMYSTILLDLGAGVLNSVASVLLRVCTDAILVSEPNLVTTAKVLQALDYLTRSHAFVTKDDDKLLLTTLTIAINKTTGNNDPRLPVILDQFYKHNIVPVEIPEDKDIQDMMDFGEYEHTRAGETFQGALGKLYTTLQNANKLSC